MRARAAYLLATVFFFVAAAGWAALPPNGYLDNEVRLEQDHQLYGQPFNNEEADKVVATDDDRAADAWDRYDRIGNARNEPIALASAGDTAASLPSWPIGREDRIPSEYVLALAREAAARPTLP